jgi:hypothetical protein
LSSGYDYIAFSESIISDLYCPWFKLEKNKI